MADPENLLSGLDDDQRAAVAALTGPVAIIAGAGSGKTRVITHRIAYAVATGEHDPARSVAVTFTTKAAGEMTRRLRKLGVPDVRVRTFHSAALRQLRYYWPLLQRGELPEITAVKAPIVGAAASVLGLPTATAAVRDFASEIEWAKVHCLTPAGYSAAATKAGRVIPADLTVERMAELFSVYESRKDAAGRMDFEDVLLLMVALLEQEPRVGSHLRPGLRHVTVDEYQDVSPLQQRLLEGWLGDNNNLCVVGDPAQTIYTFAGADSSYLTGFSRRYPEATVVKLPRTYRCTPQVVQVANRVLADAGAPLQLRSQQPDGPEVALRDYPDAVAEATGVAARIESLIDAGMPPAEIAVLVRVNAMTAPVEDALSKAGIGYHVSGSSGFFTRPDVRKAMALIRGAAVAQGPDTDVVEIVTALLAGMGWTATAPPPGTGALRTQWESLAALQATAVDWAADHPAGSLEQFANELLERAERADAPGGAGVTVASLHSAKGAEWRAVFLVGVCEGVLPHSSAKTEAEIAEEQRLFYVGITRAAQILEISYPRTSGGAGRPRRPSRFLRAIDASLMPTRQSPSATGKRRSRSRVANCRVCGKALVTGPERSLGRCRTCGAEIDEELYAALQQWRRDKVAELSQDRDGNLPAYLVATDATLQAIAEQRPTTMAELADIPGIGPRKIDDYGEALLSIINAGSQQSATGPVDASAS